jgi:hypothetical protein
MRLLLLHPQAQLWQAATTNHHRHHFCFLATPTDFVRLQLLHSHTQGSAVAGSSAMLWREWRAQRNLRIRNVLQRNVGFSGRHRVAILKQHVR